MCRNTVVPNSTLLVPLDRVPQFPLTVRSLPLVPVSRELDRWKKGRQDRRTEGRKGWFSPEYEVVKLGLEWLWGRDKRKPEQVTCGSEGYKKRVS